jgi:phosphoribosylanthranilate isomerase
VRTVGVFVNHPPTEIRLLLEQCCLDLAQLSGDEPPQELAQIGLESAFKALRSHGQRQLEKIAGDYLPASSPPAYLVDAHVPGQYGGTGEIADWGQARQLAGRFPVLLAGGLKSDNVAQAVRQVRPWGVDVASGVELAPGRKDFHKMHAFINAARSVLQEES